MARTTGSVGTKTIEYIAHYDKLTKKYGDPLVVLFKLLNARKQSFQMEAAKTLISYRYPKQAILKAEIESKGQMILGWEETTDLPLNQPIELPSLKDIN